MSKKIIKKPLHLHTCIYHDFGYRGVYRVNQTTTVMIVYQISFNYHSFSAIQHFSFSWDLGSFSTWDLTFPRSKG